MDYTTTLARAQMRNRSSGQGAHRSAHCGGARLDAPIPWHLIERTPVRMPCLVAVVLEPVEDRKRSFTLNTSMGSRLTKPLACQGLLMANGAVGCTGEPAQA